MFIRGAKFWCKRHYQESDAQKMKRTNETEIGPEVFLIPRLDRARSCNSFPALEC